MHVSPGNNSVVTISTSTL